MRIDTWDWFNKNTKGIEPDVTYGIGWYHYLFTRVVFHLQVDFKLLMMNFDDAGMGEYPSSLHGTLEAVMEPSMDPHLNPSLLQGVELDPEGLAVSVPDDVHLMEGMFSELHSAVSEVGIPVTATHFDLQEEMLWMGNHRVRWCCDYDGK